MDEFNGAVVVVFYQGTADFFRAKNKSLPLQIDPLILEVK